MEHIRKAVLAELDNTVALDGKIVISKSRAKELEVQLAEVRGHNDNLRWEFLKNYQPWHYTVNQFGSARPTDTSEEYIFAKNLTIALVNGGIETGREINIAHGDGPGIMKAVREGTKIAKQLCTTPAVTHLGKSLNPRSIGVGISTLDHEPNNISGSDLFNRHAEFATRIQYFIDRSHASILHPGGNGSLLEMAELLQAIQVKHLEPEYPLIFLPYWKPLIDVWYEIAYKQRVSEGKIGFISDKDLEPIKFSESIPDIVDTIFNHYDHWHKRYRKFVQVTP